MESVKSWLFGVVLVLLLVASSASWESATTSSLLSLGVVFATLLAPPLMSRLVWLFAPGPVIRRCAKGMTIAFVAINVCLLFFAGMAAVLVGTLELALAVLLLALALVARLRSSSKQ
jgi:hypothetical protein